MRLISWNCQKAFHRKIEYLEKYKADIHVIQECARKSVKQNAIWFGDREDHGIGIYSDKYELSLISNFNLEFKWVIPVLAKNDTEEFLLFGVWLKKHKVKAYSGHYIDAFNFYLPDIKDRKTIIIGDFNSNSIWDMIHRKKGCHTDLVSLLEKHSIYSAYHFFNNEEQGKEITPTHFYRRNSSNTFHIDYCFVSESIRNNLMSVEVGNLSDWIDKSDHAPIFLEFRT